MIAVQECLRFWGINSLIINLWNLENLEYAVKTVSYIGPVKLSGIKEKKEKNIFAVDRAIPLLTV